MTFTSITFVSSSCPPAPLFAAFPLLPREEGQRGSALIDGKASWDCDDANEDATLSITVPEELLSTFTPEVASFLLAAATSPAGSKVDLLAGDLQDIDAALPYFGIDLDCSDVELSKMAPLRDQATATHYVADDKQVAETFKEWKIFMTHQLKKPTRAEAVYIVECKEKDSWYALKHAGEGTAEKSAVYMFANKSTDKPWYWARQDLFQEIFAVMLEAEGYRAEHGSADFITGGKQLSATRSYARITPIPKKVRPLKATPAAAPAVPDSAPTFSSSIPAVVSVPSPSAVPPPADSASSTTSGASAASLVDCDASPAAKSE